MKILIVTDNPFQEAAISTWLRQSDKSCIVSNVLDYNEIDKICDFTIKPDVIIFNYPTQIEEASQKIFELCMSVTWGRVCIVVLVSNYDTKTLANLLSEKKLTIIDIQDAQHYFSNEFDPSQYRYLSQTIREAYAQIPCATHPLNSLTKTEQKISALILKGLSNKEIANYLSRSILTIEDHRKKIKVKLLLHGGKNSLLEFLRPYTSWLLSQL